MVQNFTQNDLVSYLYREVDFQKSHAINESIESNWDVFEEYKILKNAKREIPRVTFHPAPSTLTNLISLSKEK